MAERLSWGKNWALLNAYADRSPNFFPPDIPAFILIAVGLYPTLSTQVLTTQIPTKIYASAMTRNVGGVGGGMPGSIHLEFPDEGEGAFVKPTGVYTG
jgi:hypothetical protein